MKLMGEELHLSGVELELLRVELHLRVAELELFDQELHLRRLSWSCLIRNSI